MSTDYTNVNGYLIPSFALPTGSTPPLGKYGAMRARFLDGHNSIEYEQMLLDGILLRHLSEINVAACEQIETLTKQLAKQADVSTALKLHKPLEWTAQMQAFHAQAEDIVCADLIFI